MTLSKRTDYGDAKYAGLETAFTSDIEQTVNDALLCGFDFVVTPLVRPEHRPPAYQTDAHGTLPNPFNRDDVLYMGSTQWVRQVVGAISKWIDPDSSDPAMKKDSLSALKAQLGWAAHLGLQAVLLPPPPQRNCAAYAQSINQVLEDVTAMALWLTIPINAPSAPSVQADATTSEQSDASTITAGSSACTTQAISHADGAAYGCVQGDGWETWHSMRTLCSHDTLLGAVLQLGKQLPPAAQLARWYGEPVKAVLVPTSCFTLNKKGYPVLPKQHQDFLQAMFKLHVQVVLTGDCLHPNPQSTSQQAVAVADDPTPAEAAAALTKQSHVALEPETGAQWTINNPGEAHPMRNYWEYLAYLFRKLPAISEELQAENEYRDYLQAPLQPLQDNLESQTYEVFEKDVIKYIQYEEAVYKALLDRKASTIKPVVLMVVGAGRGPLVAASMRASARSGVLLKVYAVEKNPNAIVHIQELLRREDWTEQVQIVSADMRHWQAPEPADILVSELLGSFGDNELSPECLDGAQRFLAPNGISIPAKYTSYLAPVATHKSWTDVRAYKDREHFETPYVVKFHRHHLLSPIQPMFTFVHPNPSKPIDNSRYKKSIFTRDAAAGSAIMHGFAGYFDCQLYGDVMLSTHPDTHTPDMASWFPIYFPLKEPIYVPAGSTIEAHMWRCCGTHKVWYEWGVTSPVACPIHNVSGRSYYVGL